jgi:hypothetical protein
MASALCLSIGAGCARAPVATWAPVAANTNAGAEPVRAALVGEGSLEARGERTKATALAIERLRISAETSGDVAETTVEHTFRNDSDERLEGTFRFPLPEGSVLTGLALEVDGQMLPGELVEREKARKAYEQTVDEMRDPALFEWESARTFKLRVFPIEPKHTKRVMLRFLAPLHRSGEGLFFAVRLPSLDGGAGEDRVTLELNGRRVDPEKELRAATGEVCIRVGDERGNTATVFETTAQGTYVHAHVRLSLTDAPAPPTAARQALIVLCDRSRSMLEARGQQARLVRLLLNALGLSDRFVLLAGDVRWRRMAGGLRSPTADSVREALAFLDAWEPDGASNLADLIVAGGGAAQEARAQGLEPAVVYLGDANPTWGETRAGELEHVALTALQGAPLHMALVGKSIEDTTARAVAGVSHGRLLSPKSEDDARLVATKIVHAARERRLDDVRLTREGDVDVALEPPSTIFEGDDIDVSVFVPARPERPARSDAVDLALMGTVGRKPFVLPIKLGSARAAHFVAQRWAAAKIEALEREGDRNKEAIVKASLDHGVMSRYTSFLVLENEEAYERFRISRKARSTEAGEMRVSSRDLESAGGPSASVTPDHLQPGDPEVRVAAPADAQSVVAVFPFGETKAASFEPDSRGGAWVVRFLVDRHTPDGRYEILVRVTYADGRVELLYLPYVVDTRQPHLHVVVRRRAGGAYTISASQELTADEIAAQGAGLPGGIQERARALATVLTDAKRVEVRTPDGQVLSLTHLRLGEFTGVWTPGRAVAPGGTLRVIAVDRALNESVTEVQVP